MRSAFDDFGRLVAQLDVDDFEESGLTILLDDVRLVQRRLDGLVTRIGVRSNRLAALGRSAPANEMARGGGTVGSRQARREAVRAETAEAMPAVGDAASSGDLSGEHFDSLTRHITRLSDDQRACFDVDDLLAQSRLPVETFDRLVKRRVEAVIGDDGHADTTAKQERSEFRHWFDPDTGMGRFAGSLDPERYEILVNAVDQRIAAIAAASDGDVVKNRHHAVTALVDLVSSHAGGNARNRLPSITIVVDHDTATGNPHERTIRQTETGHDLAHRSLDRLCCDAVIRRVVVDEAGVPINVGRKYRTATDAQWAAIKAVHSACAWEGCSAPINWCQAHHIREWEHRGDTDLDNLVPLCSQHHHRVHEGGWRLKLLPDRSLEIFRPHGVHHTTVPPPRRC